MGDTSASRPDSMATTEGGEASSAHVGVRPADLAGMRALLEEVTLAQLIARKPPTTVTVVPAEWTIDRALQQCAAKNLLATPVVDADNSNCYGFFDINNALKAVCSWFDIHNVSNHDRISRLQLAGSRLRFACVAAHRHAWCVTGTKMHSTPVRDVVGFNTDGQLLESAHTNSPLMQVNGACCCCQLFRLCGWRPMVVQHVHLATLLQNRCWWMGFSPPRMMAPPVTASPCLSASKGVNSLKHESHTSSHRRTSFGADDG